MPLSFRNLTVSPEVPVDEWGVEGVLAAIDRGQLSDWRRLVAEVECEPWGKVARDLDQALDLAEDRGAAAALRNAVAVARRARHAEERTEVAAELRDIRQRAGLTQAEFADRLGTSRSRVSTYLTGKVTPSAAFMVRARRLLTERETRAL